MRAAVIEAFNKPWQIREMPDPRPGPGQVVIRVKASGMCGTDLHVHHGLFQLPPPIVAGHEPTGEIVALGAGAVAGGGTFFRPQAGATRSTVRSRATVRIETSERGANHTRTRRAMKPPSPHPSSG